MHRRPIERVSDFVFLGLTLDIHKASSKISRTIGILAKLKNILPRHILLSIYNALVLPYINYSLLAWGFSTNTKRILTLQKKAVRILTSSQYNANSAPIFKTLRLFTIDDILLRLVFKFIYQLNNNMLPVYFRTYKLVTNLEISGKVTRSAFNPHRTQELHK
jgi:hypothetical protein